jgi:hypothetical protein
VRTYADSSFLVSLYTPDSNSREALEEFRSAGPPFLMTPFGEFGFANTLELRVFRKELDPREAYRSANTSSELPEHTATYCFPFTMYVIGPDVTRPPVATFHSRFPLRASRA